MTKLLVLALSVVATAPTGSLTGAGNPGRGALVWTSNGCGACHAFARAGSTGAGNATAPNLDRWLVPDARRLRLATGAFVLRRVYWGGRGMAAYGTSLSAQELDDLVSFVTGASFTAPAGPVTPVAPLPPPPPLVTAPAATVRRWVRVERLPERAVRGAALFARVGCLSCHTYLGNGKRRRGAPELGASGREGRTASSFADYVARPYRRGNNLMPAYADLGADALGRIGAFLAASRGR